MANLDLISMYPACPTLVGVSVTPVGGANTGLCQWGGRCCCMRRWYSSSAHLCNGELDVHNGLGEHFVGGHQVLDGGTFLNCHICKIVE